MIKQESWTKVTSGKSSMKLRLVKMTDLEAILVGALRCSNFVPNFHPSFATMTFGSLSPSSDQLRQLTATDPKRGHADRALDAHLHEVRLTRKCWRFPLFANFYLYSTLFDILWKDWKILQKLWMLQRHGWHPILRACPKEPTPQILPWLRQEVRTLQSCFSACLKKSLIFRKIFFL